MAILKEKYNEKDIIFREGDEGDSCYVLKKGSVTIYQKNVHNEDIELAELDPGAIFGEMALIETIKRTASAIATRKSELLVINKANFELMLEKDINFAMKIISIFRDRIINSNNKFVNINISKGIKNRISGDSKHISNLPDQDNKTIVVNNNIVIFEENEIGNDGYIIIEGRVKICRILPGKKEVVFKILESGDIFGEMAIFGNHKRTASAIAVGECILLRFNSNNFLSQIKTNKNFTMKIMKIMSSRLQNLNKKISEIV